MNNFQAQIWFTSKNNRDGLHRNYNFQIAKRQISLALHKTIQYDILVSHDLQHVVCEMKLSSNAFNQFMYKKSRNVLRFFKEMVPPQNTKFGIIIC